MHGSSAEPVPVSAYGGSSKKLKDLKDADRTSQLFDQLSVVGGLIPSAGGVGLRLRLVLGSWWTCFQNRVKRVQD